MSDKPDSWTPDHYRQVIPQLTASLRALLRPPYLVNGRLELTPENKRELFDPAFQMQQLGFLDVQPGTGGPGECTYHWNVLGRNALSLYEKRMASRLQTSLELMNNHPSVDRALDLIEVIRQVAAGDAFHAATQPAQPRTDENFPDLLRFNHQDLPLMFNFGPILGQGPVLGMRVTGDVLCKIQGAKEPKTFDLKLLTLEQLTRLSHELLVLLWPERMQAQVGA